MILGDAAEIVMKIIKCSLALFYNEVDFDSYSQIHVLLVSCRVRNYSFQIHYLSNHLLLSRNLRHINEKLRLLYFLLITAKDLFNVLLSWFMLVIASFLRKSINSA